jgi:K+-sensing histidine kinase KdpD
MNSCQNQLTTPAPADAPRRRSRFERVFGRSGLLWVLAFTAMATLLRWATDGFLESTAPFSFYYLSVVLTALAAPMGSSFLAVILGGLCAHYLWVSLEFLTTAQVAQLVVYMIVASLSALVVTAARVLRLFDYIDYPDD